MNFRNKWTHIRRRKKTRDAFTLIELLVVVAIISLLISLTAPSLRGARESAMSIACASVLRPWGMALLEYTYENNDQLPGSCTRAASGFFRYPPAENQGANIFLFMAPYLGIQSTGGQWAWHEEALCPVTGRIARQVRAEGGPTIPSYAVHNTAATSIFGHKYRLNEPNPPGRPRALPSLTSDEMNRGWLSDADQFNWPGGGHENLPVQGVHRGRNNWLFFDGSVLSSDEDPGTR